MTVGVSVLLDFFGVQGLEFHQADIWEELLDAVIEIGQLTKLHISSHQFSSRLSSKEGDDASEIGIDLTGGATAYALLAESHISVHTWPEKDKVVVDVFTCGAETNLSAIINFLIEQIPHTNMTITRLVRGKKE